MLFDAQKLVIMKLKLNSQITLAAAISAVAAIILGSVPPARAALIVKADNTTALNVAGSWTNNVVPGAADTAQWDSTVSAASTTSLLGGNLSWGGLKIVNPAGNVFINAGSALTLGAGGIDMTAATADMTLSNTVNIGPGALQSWNLATGRTLNLVALPVKPGNGANTLNSGVLQFSPTGTFLIATTNGIPGASLTVPLLLDNQNNPFVTYGLNDWAALSSGQVVAATYTAATTALTAGVNNDIVGDLPGGTGSAIDCASIRFNDPTARTLNIANSATSRTMTARGVLVTANSGGGTIGGSVATSFIRPNRVSTTGTTSFNIIQNSPANFTISAIISNPNSQTTHVVKSGPGNLILASTANGYTGGTDVNGGTLTVAAGASLSSAAVVVNNTGRLVINASNTTFVASVAVNSGATNRIVINTTGAQQFVSGVAFNAGATACEFNFANGVNLSPTTAPLLVSNVTANGSIAVNIYSGSPTIGTYPLIKYTNSLTGIGYSAFSLGLMPLRTTGYLSNDVANSSLELVITNIAEPLRWAVGNSSWDIGSTVSWQDALGNATVYREANGYGDAVIFDDSASGASPIAVTLNTAVAPATVVVNATKNYSLSGTGGINSGASLTKSGSGTLTLATANAFSGGLNLNAGIVNFSALTNLGVGALNFGGGTLQYNGNADDVSVKTISLNAGGGTIDTAGSTVNFANAFTVGGGGGLTKTGLGTLAINGTNKYSGVTFVNQGTLAFGANTSVSNSVAIMVNSGATLDVAAGGVSLVLASAANQILGGSGTVNGYVIAPAGTVITPGTNGVYGTLNVANDLTISGATLLMDISNTNKDLITVGGNLYLNSGSLLVITNNTPLANGTYKLIQYSGALASGAGSSGNLTVQFSQAGAAATLSEAMAGEIDLVIASSASDVITWSGAGSTWDLAGSQNWFLGSSTPWAFTNGDSVIFNDSATGNSTVNLQATVLPGSLLVSNTTITAYTFADGTGTGGGKIGGATSLVKDGTGTLITQTANTYSGTTTIKNGTLQIGNGGIGDIGTGKVTNNGALVFAQGDATVHTVAGSISGTGSVTKQGSATVVLAQNNTYSGGTTISAGTLQLGNGGATGTANTGAITDNGTLTLNRSGTIALPNSISGTGALNKQGSSALTFAGSLTYLGNTTIGNGVVKLTANEQIPDGNSVVGSTGWLILDGGATTAGTFDLAGFNETVNALSGLGNTFNGAITNTGASATTTNTLTILGTAGTTYNGVIGNSAGGAKTAVVLLGTNTLRMNGANTYSGGTTVGGTATIGVGPGGSLGGDGVTMSNGTTYYMYNNGSTASFPGDNITIVDGAGVSINSGQLGNGFGGTVTGGVNSTNSLIGPISFNSPNVEQWSNFLGTVLIPTGGSLRFASTSLTLNGSDNATFDLEGTGSINTRNPGTVHLGALKGNGSIISPSSGTANYIIGLKGINTTFSGIITGTNNLVKSGAGTLTLNGGAFTNISTPDGFTYVTNVTITNLISYVGSTTISNGVLALVAPVTLTNFAGQITLASLTATLDASQMGYVSNSYDVDGVTVLSQSLVTNSILEIVSGQRLSGKGSVIGKLQADAGSTLNPGNIAGVISNGVDTGVLTVSGSATLNGILNLRLNNTNTVIGDKLAAASYNISGATLVITNVGPALAGGNVFHLFSSGINTNGFTSIILPTVVSPLILSNNLAVDGTLVIVSPVNPNPTNITTTVSSSGGTTILGLSWPVDHTGWYLQMQTNSLSTGLSTNWVDVPGSTTINSTNIVIDPTKPTVFYRLSLQP